MTPDLSPAGERAVDVALRMIAAIDADLLPLPALSSPRSVDVIPDRGN